jgi:hypothetical protein
VSETSSTHHDVSGRAGPDEIWGEKGSDHLEGHGLADTIYAGPGNDTIEGWRGSDTIYVGAALRLQPCVAPMSLRKGRSGIAAEPEIT